MIIKPAEFTPLHEAVFQALGQASMCWNPKPEGIFDSEEAAKIGDELIAKIQDLHTQALAAILTSRNEILDHCHTAMTIIANASGGNWDQETEEWAFAARAWTDRYQQILRTHIPPRLVERAVEETS